MHKLFGMNKETFVHYVVCQNIDCCSVNKYEDSFEKVGTQQHTKLCTNRVGSRKCYAPLLETVETSTGKRMLHAFKIFCYHPLKRSLGQLLNKPK